MAEPSERRRCPWCWERIDRAASVCEHCGKEVQPRGSAESAESTPAPAAPGQVEPAPQPAAAPIDMSTTAAQVLWWVSALLLFCILLFGVAVFVRFPSATAGTILTIGEVIAAYYANRALWSKMNEWPRRRVTILLGILTAVIVLLAVTGWVRRRFF